jgi:hypothetical protein
MLSFPARLYFRRLIIGLNGPAPATINQCGYSIAESIAYFAFSPSSTSRQQTLKMNNDISNDTHRKNHQRTPRPVR